MTKISQEMIDTYGALIAETNMSHRLHPELWTEKEHKSHELFFDITSELSSCENCPYQNFCSKYEFYYGCSVWEDYMGDDL